jgi:hypothetical protein
MRSKLIAILLCLSALPAWAQPNQRLGPPELVVFEHDGFQGRSLSLRGPTPNFEPLRFNDATSSLIVRSGAWELCAHANYGPPCRTFSSGEYRSVGEQWNDQFSSARPVNPGPGGPPPGHGGQVMQPDSQRTVDVILFEHANFEGNARALSRTVDNFETIQFNDTVSSVIIVNGSWLLCTDAGFRGDCRMFGPGEYRNLPRELNDRFSSARESRRPR